MPRLIPIIVHFGLALVPRLYGNHPKIPLIEKDIRRFMSGYRGEVTTDFHSQFLDDKNHSIFRGLRLLNGHHHFQIDTAILSRKYLLLLETKNNSGDLHIDQEQFSQTSSYGEKGYKHPIIQVNEHRDKLHAWLKSHHLHHSPRRPQPPICTH
ncbi:nuclease-related domain-containing protein [Mesobacillus campisalis]|nr:nuclease-related domain-containing protein [Mesobacillus campisalis]